MDTRQRKRELRNLPFEVPNKGPLDEKKKQSGSHAKGTIKIFVHDPTELSAHDVVSYNESERIQRCTGQRKDGLWRTYAFLVKKADLHIDQDGEITPNSEETRALFERFSSVPTLMNKEEDSYHADLEDEKNSPAFDVTLKRVPRRRGAWKKRVRQEKEEKVKRYRRRHKHDDTVLTEKLR